jgi:O-antigen ligase/tetratricopeptide (TPR) repeat protein
MKDLAKWVMFGALFAIPFIPLIVSNSMFFPFITGKNFTFRILVEIALAAWVILALYDSSYRPKFSWILGGFTALLVVMFFANLFGEYPLQSFWSNFERMEGYVTLVHVFLYIIVLGSALTTEKLWNRFLNTTLFAGAVLAIYAFAQLSGNITINQGGWRLDGTLGNSAYMAIYTLFHVFIAGLMYVRTSSPKLRYVYAALILLFAYLLIQTATRGTILGLTGGALVSAAYIALFAKAYPNVRKAAAGGLVVLALLVGAFIAFKDSSVIQSNPYLERVADINLREAQVRFDVWGISLEGIKERPILGWGQGNYNYVFNQYYDPSLYAQESWFDRVHNIILDWLIAGGVLGLIAYLSILLAALYYIFLRPLLYEDDTFTVTERGLLLGLLAGYVFHNLFVFDNIVSYIFYGTILAFIHSRVATDVPRIREQKIDTRVVEQIATPVVAVALVAVIYFVNLPGIQAASDIIDAFTSETPEVMLEEFEEGLSRGSFGDQEIREQMTRQVQSIMQAPGVTEETKQRAAQKVEEELFKQAEEKPGDARVHVFISSFYRMTGNIDKAIEQLEIARALSPEKQQIIFEQGLVYLQKQEYQTAYDYFKEAYDLAPAFGQARIFFAIAAIYNGQSEQVDELINTESLKRKFAQNDLAVQATYQTKQYDLLEGIFLLRIEANPNDPQLRVNLAVVYNESGDTERAVGILEQAGEDIPSFKLQAEQFAADLVAGRVPGQPQQ